VWVWYALKVFFMCGTSMNRTVFSYVVLVCIKRVFDVWYWYE